MKVKPQELNRDVEKWAGCRLYMIFSTEKDQPNRRSLSVLYIDSAMVPENPNVNPKKKGRKIDPILTVTRLNDGETYKGFQLPMKQLRYISPAEAREIVDGLVSDGRVYETEGDGDARFFLDMLNVEFAPIIIDIDDKKK